MVDFSALVKNTKTNSTIDPIAIFEELPKKGAVHDLYKVQAEILEAWFVNRDKHKDVVVELNTGGGKTLVGLLIALSVARETRKGALYLVENKQLVSQVVAQATQIGIPAKPYEGRDSLDADFDNGNKILVGAYQALFNGKSVFGIKGSRSEPVRIGGVIIDDAHASLRALREAFTLTVPASEKTSVYKKILVELKNAFDALGRSHSYEELYEGIGSHVIEIPYEYWKKAEDRVFSILLEEERKCSAINDDFSQSLLFNWSLIKDNLKYCHVVVSRERITIAAMYPLLHMIPSFNNAERRIYMSATIADYGDMVRAYDLRELTENAIIAPKTVSGVGRRMVLFPSEEQLASDEFKYLLQEELNEHHGIVKLASNANSELMTQLSCYEPIGNESVTEAVESLREGRQTCPVSFVNRYNGIDLPDDACRVLLLEDLPADGDDIDAILSRYLPESDITAQRIAQKIEQGVGRGVRGASDHCVVLIVGYRLIDWMKRDRNRRFFSPPLRAQIIMGEEIADDIHTPADFCDAMNQELASEDSWVDYHALRLARSMPDSPNRLGGTFESARVERRAFSLWTEGRPKDAIESILEKLDSFNDDKQYQGWLLSIASRIAYDGESELEAAEYAKRAHSLNRAIDVAQSPCESAAPAWAIAQAHGVFEKIKSLKSSSIINQFDFDMSGLSFGKNTDEFEASLQMLGTYLGFESSCEDHNGEGPDVCWIEPLHQTGWAIEVKSGKDRHSSFHKRDAGQLRTARDWMLQKYPGIKAEAVSVHPAETADQSASASNLKVLRPDSLDTLRRNARLLLKDVGSFADANKEMEIARILADKSMGLKDLTANYLVPFKTRKAAKDDSE